MASCARVSEKTSAELSQDQGKLSVPLWGLPHYKNSQGSALCTMHDKIASNFNADHISTQKMVVRSSKLK